MAGLRRADRRDVLHRLVAAVDDHATAARNAGQPPLLRQLDAFLADIVVAGEADDLRGDLAAGIEPAIFVLVVQAGNAQRHRAFRDFGGDLPAR